MKLTFDVDDSELTLLALMWILNTESITVFIRHSVLRVACDRLPSFILIKGSFLPESWEMNAGVGSKHSKIK